MALGNIRPYLNFDGTALDGGIKYKVAAAATTINPGEPVAKALGNASGNVVTAAADATPVVGTDTYAGVSVDTSTETTGTAGEVTVIPISNEQMWLCAPTVPGSWDTQAKYDALVGARVTFALNAGVYTVNATDGATNGLVVEPLDISLYPNLVAFRFRNAVNYIA